MPRGENRQRHTTYESLSWGVVMARREHQGQPAGIFDFLFGEMRSAVQDVRSKLIDEGWFGRRAAPPSQLDAPSLGWHREPTGTSAGPPRQSFEEAWAPRERGDTPDVGEPAGPDLDR